MDNLDFLPKDSQIIRLLIERSKERPDVLYDFIGKLNGFAEVVSQEVQFINLLFPEFTPHDKDYHLKRLFFVAETILGEDAIQNLNSAELFILSAALFGHDWGMAVSEPEKLEITSATEMTTLSGATYALLSNEKQLYSAFCSDNDIIDKNKPDIQYWREYVRQTHAYRSGSRVRKYFEKDGSGIGEAIARASEGHWLNFDKLEDNNRYPTDYSVLRESINLRAISIYVRLIDLFDIGDDRTPYIIWKFVAPRSDVSQFEWAKHRSLNPITTSSYQGGRILRIDGSTSDHLVYSAIIDLKNYCDKQLKSCNDLLAYLNDQRYKIDIFYAEWRVNAIGFEPIQVQFEFERNRMFEILSTSIYDDDPFVFLRELLQNSIDAINLRKKVLLKKRISFEGEISIKIKDANDFFDVEFIDNGTGMDEYLVRNYLSVVGRSYYKSEAFEKLKLDVDPISQFGIGILSCFMISDSMIIETRRDPYISNTQPKNLVCFILEVDKQFRVEFNTKKLSDFGTIISLKVSKKKLKKYIKNVNNYDVFEYLSQIAAFSYFPIYIEDTEKRVLVHPQRAVNVREGYKEVKLDLGLSLEEAFEYHSVKEANEVFHIETLDLGKDLNLTDCEGIISFLKFNSNVKTFKPHGSNWPRTIHEFEISDSGVNRRVKVNIKEIWVDRQGGHEKTFPSARRYASFAMFSNGILISGAPLPKFRGSSLKVALNDKDSTYAVEDYFFDDYYCSPKLIINYFHGKKGEISISRNQLLDNVRWDISLFDALIKYLSVEWEKTIDQTPINERLKVIGKFIIEYRININDLVEKFKLDGVPIAFIEPQKGLQWIEFGNIKYDNITLVPSEIEFLSEFKYSSAKYQEAWDTILSQLPMPVFTNINRNYRRRELFTETTTALISGILQKKYLLNSLIFHSYKFGNKVFCLAHLRFNKIEITTTISHKHIANQILNEYDIFVNNGGILALHLFDEDNNIKNLASFPPEFGKCISYGFRYLNVNHPIIIFFLRCYAKLYLEGFLKDYKNFREFNFLLRNTIFSKEYYGNNENLETINRNLIQLFNFMERHTQTKYEKEIKVDIEQFVESSVFVTKIQLLSSDASREELLSSLGISFSTDEDDA